MPKLTKRAVENLPVEAGDYIVFDSEVSGFGIRVLPSGVKSYLVQYRNGGRTRRLALGKHGALTSEEARRLAVRRLGEVAQGDDPSEARRQRLAAPNMSEFCTRFVEDHVRTHLKPKTQYDYERLINRHIRKQLGAFKVADIRRVDIANLHHKMRGTPHQANRVLAVLSKMFNTAELWGLRPDGSNPCRLIPKNREKPKERFLNEIELVRLGEVFAEAEDTHQESLFAIAAYRLLLLTGCRLPALPPAHVLELMRKQRHTMAEAQGFGNLNNMLILEGLPEKEIQRRYAHLVVDRARAYQETLGKELHRKKLEKSADRLDIFSPQV